MSKTDEKTPKTNAFEHPLDIMRKEFHWLPELPGVDLVPRGYDERPDAPLAWRAFDWRRAVFDCAGVRTGDGGVEPLVRARAREAGVFQPFTWTDAQGGTHARRAEYVEIGLEDARAILLAAETAAEPLRRRVDLLDRQLGTAAANGGPIGYVQRARLYMDGNPYISELERLRIADAAGRCRGMVEALGRRITMERERMMQEATAGVREKFFAEERAREEEEADRQAARITRAMAGMLGGRN
jgi:hypothetical protein